MIVEDQEISNNMQVELINMILLGVQDSIIQIEEVLDQINMMHKDKLKCSKNILDNEQQLKKISGNNTNNRHKRIIIIINKRENILFLL